MMEFTSQINQDKFVVDILKYKQNGTFLDIGCGQYKDISNTYFLEHTLNWTGIGIDVEDHSENYKKYRPNTKFYCHDALTFDYITELTNYFGNNATIDFLSMDLEPPEITYQCLKLIPFDKFKFNIIAFETDWYREKRFRVESRQYFKSFGYNLIADVNEQDDIYIHSSLL